MNTGSTDSRGGQRLGLATLAAAAIAFIIYAALVREIHPTQDNAFIPERSSLAAAVSNVVYGAPLGTVYTGVLTRFFEDFSSTEKILGEAARMEIRPRVLDPNTRDGNGIGYMLVSRFAFRYFGTHISSVVKTMLLLMAISAAAFLYRFRDRRALLVVVYFTALTFMLFTPLAWHPYYVKEIPIGGIRYFSLLGVLPAFHLLLELGDPRRIEREMRDLLPLGAQVTVLLTAILVRNSAAPMLAAIGTAGLWYLWRSRASAAAVRLALGKAAYMALIGAAFVGVLIMSFSRGYLSEGRFTETVWHRIFVGLGMNPAWPFGNLREVYDCRKWIPEGLVYGPEDRNGHCVFLVNIAKHGIKLENAGGTYGRQYDASLREEFFNILRAYPLEVLSTFTYHKLRALALTVGRSLNFDFSLIPPALPWFLAAALANCLIALALLGPPASAGPGLSPLSASALFAAFSTLPLIAVWAAPYTAGDFFCFSLIATGILLGTGAARLGRGPLPRP